MTTYRKTPDKHAATVLSHDAALHLAAQCPFPAHHAQAEPSADGRGSVVRVWLRGTGMVSASGGFLARIERRRKKREVAYE